LEENKRLHDALLIVL